MQYSVFYITTTGIYGRLVSQRLCSIALKKVKAYIPDIQSCDLKVVM